MPICDSSIYGDKDDCMDFSNCDTNSNADHSPNYDIAEAEARDIHVVVGIEDEGDIETITATVEEGDEITVSTPNGFTIKIVAGSKPVFTQPCYGDTGDGCDGDDDSDGGDYGDTLSDCDPYCDICGDTSLNGCGKDDNGFEPECNGGCCASSSESEADANLYVCDRGIGECLALGCPCAQEADALSGIDESVYDEALPTDSEALALALLSLLGFRRLITHL